MNFFAAADYGCIYLLPGIAIHEVRCPDPECQELHGYMISFSWLFWAAGFSFLTGGQQP